ncbi:hypothetical protein [Microbacterium sp. GCS4]|uniref:hypothetical protein n=1 Tax=Microbacterium sp. GCS4 TaxID=1692239 RepID=UPI000680944A|nr:hypothetical protein [Microbacterium sp. GCS4]KNY06914.1 hypothetical protein AKH00_00865 [Microbacterium sp. GCS4]
MVIGITLLSLAAILILPLTLCAGLLGWRYPSMRIEVNLVLMLGLATAVMGAVVIHGGSKTPEWPTVALVPVAVGTALQLLREVGPLRPVAADGRTKRRTRLLSRQERDATATVSWAIMLLGTAVPAIAAIVG